MVHAGVAAGFRRKGGTRGDTRGDGDAGDTRVGEKTGGQGAIGVENAEQTIRKGSRPETLGKRMGTALNIVGML